MKHYYVLIFLLLIGLPGTAQQRAPNNKAIFLEDISWTTARQLLTPDAVVVIPVGAGSKEHGPHLPLSTDFLQADGFKNLVARDRRVIMAPTVTYGFYPAFLKYAGSTSTNFSTATDLTLQIVRSLAYYGPKRFYIINIGVSTTPTMEAAAKILADEGILLYFSRYDRPNFVKAEGQFRTRAFSGHADEIETSNVLNLRPDLVDMGKAVNDSSIKNVDGLYMTPVPMTEGKLNTSGINGYAALGSKEKGRLNMRAFANELIREIDSIATCPLPTLKDRRTESQQYAGAYTGADGKKLVVYQANNALTFTWNDRDFQKYSPLYRDGDDYFSSLVMDILFVKNDQGKVVKAWCRNRGTTFWLTKVN